MPVASAQSVAVEREMPSSAMINQNFNVVLNATVDEQEPPIAYVITENYPAGIEVVDCVGCVHEQENKIMKWLVYSSEQNATAPSTTITYTVKATITGTKVFNGGVTADEQIRSVGGDSIISITETSCSSNWSCTAWSPSICPLGGIQNRSCTDLNNCGTNEGRPAEVQDCTYVCNPSWTCTSWSECSNNEQTRVCTDDYNCGINTDKPAETQECSSGSGGGSTIPTCIPLWMCSDWSPTKCPSSEIQTRSCTDANNCNTSTNKPSELLDCNYIEDAKPIEQPKNETKVEVINKTKAEEKTPTGTTLTGIFSSNLIIISAVVCVIGVSALLLKKGKKTSVTAYSYKPTNFCKI